MILPELEEYRVMATVSFIKSFVIESPTAINAIINDLENPRKVEVSTRDYNAENAKGIKLLKQRLSNFKR
jgi:hypothetical protein